MATVSAMAASSVSGSFAIRRASSTVSTFSSVARPAFVSRRAVQIRCNVDPESKFTPSETPSSVTPTIPLTPAPAAPVEKKASFGDIFAFTGPAPEIINGRLAMLGFVAALGAELATGETLSSQLGNGGVSAFVFAAVLFSTASLIPLFKGVSTESKSKPFWSGGAETTNGRVAMIGLVALAITEFIKGAPLL